MTGIDRRSTRRGQERHAQAPRVLVVDDDPDYTLLVVEVLEEGLGCEVTCASNAEEAVKTFLSGAFDLITLDHRMPGLHGMDIHKVLSQEFGAGKRTTGFVARKLPPVLIVTGYAEDPEIIRGQFGESIVGVLQKRVHMEELERVVSDILGGEQAREVRPRPYVPHGTGNAHAHRDDDFKKGGDDDQHGLALRAARSGTAHSGPAGAGSR